MSSATLNHNLVRPAQGTPDRALIVLHGILGSGANLRTVTQAMVQADPRFLGVLVDLRMHGRSQGFSPPHTVEACAQDLLALERTLPVPVRAIMGHSFGGKVALAYHAHRPDLERLVSLDSSPGPRHVERGSEQTLAILDMLERLPPRFERREDFVARVRAEGHSPMIADWLAMNLSREPDGFRVRLDVPAVRALVTDYFALDLWPVLEGSRALRDVVIGGRSVVWRESELERLEALARRDPERVRVHTLREAGHWLHVDDPEGLVEALVGSREQPG